MSVSVASPTVLLNRIFSLREPCPFLLVSDTFVQSATFLTDELVHKARTSNPELKLVYLSFETVCVPSYIKEGRDVFVRLLEADFETQFGRIFSDKETLKHTLIVVDSFNYIPQTEIIKFLKFIMKPNHTVYGVYHQDIPPLRSNSDFQGPSSYSYLHFLSSCVFEIKPTSFEEHDSLYHRTLENGPCFPVGVHSTQQYIFFIHLTYRRKSGRSLEYNFKINSKTHKYEDVKQTLTEVTQDDESLLKDLTTFNLGTTKKQKEQRDKVDLPFLEAQKSMGSVGGSIVYEFEKDDDYDEEDPYEDPF